MVNDVRTELHYDGAWQDITTDVRYSPPITMDWGRADESTKPAPSSLKLALHDPTGKYSPRNPSSPLFGKIGRNTPIRVRFGTSVPGMELPGVDSSYAGTPDVAALDITGDIDIRIEAQRSDWLASGGQAFARKYVVTNSQRSWAWWIDAGKPVFRWSANGGTTITAFATVAVPDDGARRAIRVTLDVDNGASGNDVTFYTAPGTAGPWTQLGAVITTAGVTSIFSSTSNVDVGRTNSSDSLGIGTRAWQGKVFAFELRNGIGGSVVANPDFSTLDAGDLTLTDGTGKVWMLHGVAAISDPSVRMAGEVSAWPPSWDLSGSDVSIPVTASGIRRRLGQGQADFRSALYRGLTSTNIATPVGYWPMEDGADSETLASAFPGHPAMGIVQQDISLAAFDDSPASDSIPTFTTGVTLARVPAYTASNDLRVMFLAGMPATLAADASPLQIITTGTARKWRLTANTGDSLRLRAWDADDVSLLDTTYGITTLGQRGLMFLYLRQDGADIAVQFGWQAEDAASTVFGSSTVVGHTKGSVTSIRLGAFSGGTLNGMAIGHLVVLNTSEFWEVVSFSKAWSGETAVDRITRLCAEEDVPLRINGTASDSQLVGPQRIGTFLDLVDAAAEVDHGILTDDRDAVRLLYRSGADLYNQAAALTLGYSQGDVAPTFEPVEDDQATRNDITAKRPEGSSARVVLESGPLSVQPPPNGVGRYDDSRELITFTDGDLVYQAGWLLHLGTVDEARYPSITVDLSAVPTLADTAMSVFPGDRVQVTEPPEWLPPDTIDQLAQGGTESLTPHRHLIEYVCTPASPWDVAVIGEVTDRVDTDGSSVASTFISGTSTSMIVAVDSGPLWTTTGAEFPFHIRVSGVVLNVTAISGAATPQTFTVDQAPVNGVIKTIAVDSDVRLDQPAIIGL